MVSSPTLFTGALPLKSLNQRCPDRESFCAVSSAFARKLFSVRSVLPKASLNDAFSPLQSTTSTETNNNPAPVKKQRKREGPLSDHALLPLCVFSFQQVFVAPEPASQPQQPAIDELAGSAAGLWRAGEKQTTRSAAREVQVPSDAAACWLASQQEVPQSNEAALRASSVFQGCARA